MTTTTIPATTETATDIQRDWATDPRWAGVERTYTAEDVVRLRGRVQEEHKIGRASCRERV